MLAGDGLHAGEAIGPFNVIKVGGAPGDGVQEGEEVCYRCRYGSSPMVMVFARQDDPKIEELLKQLDQLISLDKNVKLRAMLVLLGEDLAVLRESGAKLALKTHLQHVPVVVSKDLPGGPEKYKLSKDAQVTILLAKESKVVSAKTSAANAINVGAVIREVQAMTEPSQSKL